MSNPEPAEHTSVCVVLHDLGYNALEEDVGGEQVKGLEPLSPVELSRHQYLCNDIDIESGLTVLGSGKSTFNVNHRT